MKTPPNRSVLSLKRDARETSSLEERLQKVLANAGLGSRRSLEERIEAGEVRVNGNVATLGSSVRSGDRVELDGKAFMAVTTEPEEAQVLIYHKPDGEVTTTDDPQGRPTVFENLPRLKTARWVSIGRLDINTTGLLVLTTDGELANAMMHPSAELEREYVCRIHGPVNEEMLERLRNGIELDDGPARFDQIAIINLGENHSWLRVTLHEGRNREVRRMWESQGVQVSRLKRIRYGAVELPRELRRGHWRVLPPETYRALRTAVGLSEAPQTLTLQAVIGVRRAAKTANEFRPTGRVKSSFDLHGSDEARELRAFDVVREDRPAKRRFAKKPGGGGAGRRGRGGAGAGGWNDNAGTGRAWSPGPGLTAPGGQPDAARRKHRRPPGKGGQPGMPFGFPSDHAYARRDEGGPARGPRPAGNPSRGPGGGQRGPQPGGRGPGGPGGRGPGGSGARGPGARGPGGPGSRGPGGGNPGGGRGPGPGRSDGGNRPPRGNKPGRNRSRPG